MSFVLQKGSEYNAEYASTDFPTLDANWSGTVSLYLTYPTGTATLVKTLTRVGNKFTLNLTVGEILNLQETTYAVITSITNPVLGVTVSSLEYATVVPVVGGTPKTMCIISMTILKSDGTPAGKSATALQNTSTGTQVISSWDGVKVTATYTPASNIGTDIIGIEPISTFTNASGYAQLAVIQGLTVNITCPSLGVSTPVNTTGETAIDLSDFF
jgi:hypothetical protein